MLVDELEAAQASRVLSIDESLILERSLRRLGPKREIWRWSAKEDRRLKLLIKRRGFSLRGKPFQRNDEVQRIAQDMGRSYLAVLKRIERLRRQMICPNANGKRKG
jgi:hypothetical protein